MVKKLDLILAGRAGIDLNTTVLNCPFAQIPSFTKSIGGSPANIAQGAARLGLRTGFVGKVAKDGMGEYILQSFKEQGIDTFGIQVDHTGARNCIALTEILSPDNSGTYQSSSEAFHHGTYLYREGTADLLLSPDEIDEAYIADARAVLLSGTAFSASPSREAMFQIIKHAKKHETAVILDIDYRPFGWKSREEAARCYTEVVVQADVVIGNREEFDAVEYLTMPDNKDNEHSARTLIEQGVRLVIVKDGAKGSWGYVKEKPAVQCQVIPTRALKTFGSGDAYAAGLMYGLLNDCSLRHAMQLGTACASIALTNISCADGIPKLEKAEQVRTAYFERNKG
ncbi:5-dehydro-2-deoxygluconokinase [Ruminococcus sp. OA3]|uniref:5-dehydro-2-deoxygluconokinase n=1 Tax=Ruminococcus sp. OA3 TaxID=2914164 RepID=UPI001F0549FB|nr:5-dehydro-2-deoxygluconokinase [Ruminococcus sp. OA3]MCH1982419.1 5-dehydro-2-deoxygluconokinase [Ruminococcus sp. OA3]